MTQQHVTLNSAENGKSLGTCFFVLVQRTGLSLFLATTSVLQHKAWGVGVLVRRGLQQLPNSPASLSTYPWVCG